MPQYDDDNVPSAAPQSDSMRWYKCDYCAHLHLVLIDEDDHEIAQAVIDRNQLLNMLATVDGN